METKNRDFLANERTFLAYLRTSLSFIAFGFVIARFALFAREFSVVAHEQVPDTHASTGFGVGMAVVGVLVALYGTLRYARTHTAIVDGAAAPMPPRSAAAFGFVLALIGVIVAVALFAFR